MTQVPASSHGGGQSTEAPQWTSVTLSAAQVLGLETTPVTIVSAPGGRNYIVPHLQVFHYRFNTTPYTGDATHLVSGFGPTIANMVSFGTWASGAGSAGSFSGANLLAQTADAYGTAVYDNYDAWLASELENKAWLLAADDGIGFAGGDGTLTVRLLHSIIDGAP